MGNNKSDIQDIMEQIVQFTIDRDWDQFHNGKDLALALSVEASELNEAFLWVKAEDVNVEKVKEELADIMNYAFLIADKYDLDIKDIILSKLSKNAEKYPVNKSKGSAKKYTEL
jgi:Predicted pyrophosphatase